MVWCEMPCQNGIRVKNISDLKVITNIKVSEMKVRFQDNKLWYDVKGLNMWITSMKCRHILRFKFCKNWSKCESKAETLISEINRNAKCYDRSAGRDGLVETLWPITQATWVRFPVGVIRWKSVRVSGVNYHLLTAIPQARYRGIQKGLVETGELSVSALFSVTRHNKELVEVQPCGQVDQLHTLQHSPHICIQVEGGQNREICTPPLKYSRGYEKFSLKRDSLVILWMLVNESLNKRDQYSKQIRRVLPGAQQEEEEECFHISLILLFKSTEHYVSPNLYW